MPRLSRTAIEVKLRLLREQCGEINKNSAVELEIEYSAKERDKVSICIVRGRRIVYLSLADASTYLLGFGDAVALQAKGKG